jgi:hypothetical protein
MTEKAEPKLHERWWCALSTDIKRPAQFYEVVDLTPRRVALRSVSDPNAGIERHWRRYVVFIRKAEKDEAI